jgi:hypothetical protein
MSSGLVDFTNEADITHKTCNPLIPLIPSAGSNLIIAEWSVGNTETVSTMHRTASLDISVMIAGTGK